MKIGEAIELLYFYREIFGVNADVVFKSLPVIEPEHPGTSNDYFSYVVNEARGIPTV